MSALHKIQEEAKINTNQYGCDNKFVFCRSEIAICILKHELCWFRIQDLTQTGERSEAS